MKNISINNLQKYDKEYRIDKYNKIIEDAIKNVGIDKVCLNNNIVNNTYDVFNIELPKSKIYNQENSLRCWIHAGINLIKNNVAKNLNIEEKEYALSVNYIAFLDKIEKANSLYNQIIENEKFNLDDELSKFYLIDSAYEGGYFYFFKSIVNKYGIVPENIMPDVESSKNSDTLIRLYNDKIKKDLSKLINNKNKSKEELYTIKDTMLKENYNLLSKCLGELPMKFDYEYKNKDGQCIKIKDITPLEFKEKYLSINLDDYVGIANVPMYNKEYGKLYRKENVHNVYEKSFVEFVNLPIEDLKRLAIKHLKDGIPVYFGCDVKKMREYYKGIMDANLYSYKDIFGIDLLTKEEALTLHDICYQHVMLITGVHIEDDKPVRWKIEDSYGNDVHKDGYYIMNDNYFNDFEYSETMEEWYVKNIYQKKS